MLQSVRTEKQYVSMVGTIAGILKHEGPIGFFRGYPIMLFNGIGGSFALVAYDGMSGKR